jgi:DNA-binding response OmpR family regulator
LRSGGFYCSACLARLTASDLEDWKLLVEIETQQSDATLSGDAYEALARLVSDAVELSPAERRLLQRLAAEPAYVVSHQELAEALWGYEAPDLHDRAALRQQVTALRRKLARLRVGVTAVPAIGYRLTMTEDAPAD